jgi:hypothetical protein
MGSTQCITKGIERREKELEWLRFLGQNWAVLESIEDIAKLGALWACWIGYNEEWKLWLSYAGEAHNHKDAAGDLGRIMDALKCKSLTLKYNSHHDRRPDGCYAGTGVLGDRELEIRLNVGWLPEGCVVRTSEPRRTWSEQRTYSVYCRR